MMDSITDYLEWLEAIQMAVRKEDNFQEGRKLKITDCSRSASSRKRKRNEPVAAVTKKPKYTTKDKRVYQAKKMKEKAAKKPAAPQQKIMHRVWGEAHSGIDQKEIDQRKAKSQCARCTLMNHRWKHCHKEIQISTI